MTAILSIVISALAAASAAVLPQVTDLVKDNPTTVLILNALAVIVAALAKSPFGGGSKPQA